MNLQAVEQFLDLVSNTKKYQDALQELKDRHSAIQEAMALTYDLANVSEQKAVAEKAVSDSRDMLKKAKDKADAIHKQALDRISEQESSIVARAEKLAKQEKEFADKSAALEASINAAIEKTNDLASKEAHLNNWYARLADQQHEIDARLEQLRAVMK